MYVRFDFAMSEMSNFKEINLSTEPLFYIESEGVYLYKHK